MKLKINGTEHEVDVDPATPLLWVLRDHLQLTGTKYACGIAFCGACTVQLEGNPVRSCTLPVNAVDEQNVTTIEGLSDHPVQQAWVEHDVPQCGYCQSGMIMAAVSLLEDNPNPSDTDIDQAMTNICRCGSYNRVRAAIHTAASGQRKAS